MIFNDTCFDDTFDEVEIVNIPITTFSEFIKRYWTVSRIAFPWYLKEMSDTLEQGPIDMRIEIPRRR